MTVPGNIVPLLMSEDAAAGGYQVSRSLRFNGTADSSYLSRTPASAGNRKTYTWSGWIKRSVVDSGRYMIFSADVSNSNNTIEFNNNSIDVYHYQGGYTWRVLTTAVYRDVSAWYHVVVAVDTTQATASNRVRIYVNGSEVTAFSTASYPSQNSDGAINNTVAHNISGLSGSSGYYFNGYLAEVHLIDGQQLTPSSFGETDSTTGQWIPRLYSGSYGSQGWKLTFADNSAATAAALGKDTSGNSNNWTPNNLSVTAGAGNDSTVDTPTSYGTDTGAGGEVRGNYATWNPLISSTNLTNGNLSVVQPSTTGASRYSTLGMSTGKWYWEISVVKYSNTVFGIRTPGGGTLETPYDSTGYGMGWRTAGGFFIGGSNTGTGSMSLAAGDVLGLAFDADAGTLKFYKNGTLNNTLTASSTYIGQTWFAGSQDSGGGNSDHDVNFGQRSWAYAPPSGHKALCDTNLPAPVVAKPSTVMDVVLYSGTGSSQTVTGLNFNPDFVWLKRRSSAQAHYLYDVIRGTSSVLYSDGADAEQSISTGLTAFNSNGFSLGSLSGVNASSTANVAWAWDAGTSTVTNNNGSISSQVRANASAGFSVVSVPGYTYPTKIAGHGLNVEPHFIISKNRGVSNPWMIYHKAAGANTYFQFDTGAGYTGVPGVWSGVNSTVFPINSGINQQTDIIAYCFAPVANYSSMGSYVGDGSTSGFGPFIHCGFRPKFILIKGSTVAYSWLMFDSVRNPYNLTTQVLYADSSTSEMTNNGTGSGGYESIDILSNGFQIKSNSSRYNQSGATYIYFAVAESPFQYARAR